MVALWAEGPDLRTRVAALDAKRREPVKDARHSSVPPVKPIVTRVEQYGGWCASCGQPYVAPLPAGREAGTPFGASVQRLATSLRYTHALS